MQNNSAHFAIPEIFGENCRKIPFARLGSRGYIFERGTLVKHSSLAKIDFINFGLNWYAKDFAVQVEKFEGFDLEVPTAFGPLVKIANSSE